MKNATGSKSACTPNPKAPKTPAQGGAPEVMLETGTTVVLPSPADAPPPPKTPGRKKKASPTVATKVAPGAPGTEVPEWAKRAAAHDTAAEMAAVPEAKAHSEPAARPADATPSSTKSRSPKAPKPTRTKTDAPTATPGTLRAIGDTWIDSLRSAGHSVSTVSSYTNDLEVAHEFFGDVKAADLTEKQIAAFNVSKGVMKKANGKPRAMPTILKTRRVLRLALTWAVGEKSLAKAPYAAKAPA